MSPGGIQGPGRAGRRIEVVPKPPITIACDCGATGYAAYGENWRCPTCSRSWDTTQIPADEYGALVQTVRRYRLFTVVPVAIAAAVLVPLGLLVSLRFALLFFVLAVAWTTFVVPRLRRRAMRRALAATTRWSLRPEQP
jgi:hypothetical protein